MQQFFFEYYSDKCDWSRSYREVMAFNYCIAFLGFSAVLSVVAAQQVGHIT